MPVTDSIIRGISSHSGPQRDAEYSFPPASSLGGKKKKMLLHAKLNLCAWRISSDGSRGKDFACERGSRGRER